MFITQVSDYTRAGSREEVAVSAAAYARQEHWPSEEIAAFVSDAVWIHDCVDTTRPE
jgi:hypothetical protein